MSSSSTPMVHEARPPRRASSFARHFLTGDEATYLLTMVSALSVVVITSSLFYQLFTNSALSRHKFGWQFLFTTTWDPVAGQFGALPFIYGTVVTSALALLLAVPLGVGAAIFLA